MPPCFRFCGDRACPARGGGLCAQPKQPKAYQNQPENVPGKPKKPKKPKRQQPCRPAFGCAETGHAPPQPAGLRWDPGCTAACNRKFETMVADVSVFSVFSVSPKLFPVDSVRLSVFSVAHKVPRRVRIRRGVHVCVCLGLCLLVAHRWPRVACRSAGNGNARFAWEVRARARIRCPLR